jgi:hypothetical protein
MVHDDCCHVQLSDELGRAENEAKSENEPKSGDKAKSDAVCHATNFDATNFDLTQLTLTHVSENRQ